MKDGAEALDFSARVDPNRASGARRDMEAALHLPAEFFLARVAGVAASFSRVRGLMVCFTAELGRLTGNPVPCLTADPGRAAGKPVICHRDSN